MDNFVSHLSWNFMHVTSLTFRHKWIPTFKRGKQISQKKQVIVHADTKFNNEGWMKYHAKRWNKKAPAKTKIEHQNDQRDN